MTEQSVPNIQLQQDGYPGMNPETQPATLDVGDISFNSVRTAIYDKKSLLYKPEKRHDSTTQSDARKRQMVEDEQAMASVFHLMGLDAPAAPAEVAAGESSRSPEFKRPPLTALITPGVPGSVYKTIPSPGKSSLECSASEIYFPGLNTPEQSPIKFATSPTVMHGHLKHFSPSPPRGRSRTVRERPTNHNFTTYREPPTSISSQTTLYSAHPTTSVGSSSGYPGYQFSPLFRSLEGPSSAVDRSKDATIPVITYQKRFEPPPPNCKPLRAFGATGANRTYFELYKPVNTKYPDMWESNDVSSPVVRIPSAACHYQFSSVWRELPVARAQEIFEWEVIYEQTLEKALFQLSAVSRQGALNANYTRDEIWKTQKINQSAFIKNMRQSYEGMFGMPSFAKDDSDIMDLIKTFDTCCSRINQLNPFDENPATAGSDGMIHIAMKFGQDHGLVRRYMRQIVIDPGHIYATAGALLMLRADLWDPHQDFQKMAQNTTFRLDPAVPWLQWHELTRSFSGVVPTNLGANVDGGNKARSGYCRVELNIIATTLDILSRRTYRETFVRAKVNIWVQSSGLPSMFDAPEDNEPAPATFDISQGSRATEAFLSRCKREDEDSGASNIAIADSQSNKNDDLERYEDTEYDSYILDHSFDTDLSGSEAWLVGEMDECMIPQPGNYNGLQSISRRYSNVSRPSPAKNPRDLKRKGKCLSDHGAEDRLVDEALQVQLAALETRKHGPPEETKGMQDARQMLNSLVISEVDRVMSPTAFSENSNPIPKTHLHIGNPISRNATPSRLVTSPGRFIWDYSPSAWHGIGWGVDGGLEPRAPPASTAGSSNEGTLELDGIYDADVLDSLGGLGPSFGRPAYRG